MFYSIFFYELYLWSYKLDKIYFTCIIISTVVSFQYFSKNMIVMRKMTRTNFVACKIFYSKGSIQYFTTSYIFEAKSLIKFNLILLSFLLWLVYNISRKI